VKTSRDPFAPNFASAQYYNNWATVQVATSNDMKSSNRVTSYKALRASVFYEYDPDASLAKLRTQGKRASYLLA